jgi:hypothetical protein
LSCGARISSVAVEEFPLGSVAVIVTV